MRRAVSPLLLTLALTSCVAPPQDAPPPRPVAPVTMAPPPAAIAPTTVAPGTVEAGDWSYAASAHATTARFVTPSQSSIFVIQCDRMLRSLSLLVARPGGTSANSVTLRATSMVKTFPAGGGGPYATVAVPVREPILDALAFSRGRFGVSIEGQERWLSAWPEFARVVEDCRA